MINGNLVRRILGYIAMTSLIGGAGEAVAAQDVGKKACAQEARRLCSAEMRSLSRKKVEACMIARIDQTSEVCHAAMLRIKAERNATAKR